MITIFNNLKWAWKESNLRPLLYQRSVLPLNHTPKNAHLKSTKIVNHCYQRSVLPLNFTPVNAYLKSIKIITSRK